MLLGTFLVPALAQDVPHDWSYDSATGPEHWGDLNPAYSTCKTGRAQSPIDISNPTSESLPAIHFEYKSSPLKIIDTGHTVQANYSAGSFVSVGGIRYELKQFHFHHPGEERILGKSYPMVLHLVHADREGKLMVVAVPLKSGAASTTIHAIWTHFPKIKGVEQDISGTQLNAADLLPHDVRYFTYSGSLTTPPCTEGVTWIVLKTPVAISAEQINAFGAIYPHNARPLQPTGDRVVKSSR
jgi:carbonic anhydrase